jgi:uncharacterized oxidoreductase
MTTVLVTGGATGIGFALAERYLDARAEVLICGRRAEALDAARVKRPELRTFVCDLAHRAQREALVEWALGTSGPLDTLVNNAGVQRRVRLAAPEPWASTEQELAVNLAAPIHLTQLLLQHLLAQHQATIVNVTSGLAFVPLATVPIYCATKAAMHSFTLSLRQQLAGTSVRVVELIPPAVDTDLGGPGLHKFGVPIAELAEATFARVLAGEPEVAHGFAQQSSRASREELDGIFARMNAPR